MQGKVTAHEIQKMIRHWLSVPPNGYLGSPYGCDRLALLQLPQSTQIADEFLAKMIADIPILGALPPGAVNIYVEELSNDKKRILIDVANSLIPVDL